MPVGSTFLMRQGQSLILGMFGGCVKCLEKNSEDVDWK